MKYLLLLSLVSFLAVTHAAEDPTRPADALADALKARLTDAEGLRLQALVVGAAEEGVALVGKSAETAVAVRRGSHLTETLGGVKVDVAIKSVTARGVELATSKGAQAAFLPGSFTALAAPTNPPAEFLRYLECNKVALGRLVRLLADQTGVNASVTDAAEAKNVSIFLRNVTAEDAVEEICRATGLWFRRDPEGRIIRVSTMKEYADNLNSFREEATKTFTLLYPNVVEIASVIYGLYPDRTLLSLGEEEFEEDDEYDLSRRFRRFRVIEENGNSQFMDMQAPQASATGGRSGGGTFSFSRGGTLSRFTQWDQLRRRGRIGGEGFYASPQAMLSAADAKQLEGARRAGDTNAYERVYHRNTPSEANIFVTMSRKNNLLIVRTSDVRVMDEITQLVRKLDVPTPMVLMELRVLELSLNDDFTAQFEWQFNGHARDLGSATEGAANVVADLAQTAVMDSFVPTMAFKVISDDVVSRINLLEKDGKVKTLATPTLLTANNEVSRIFNGQEYPLVSGWTPGESDTTQGVVTRTEPTVEIEKKDVGDMLLITPNINSDRTVTLRLLQENSAVSPNKVSIPVTGGTGEDKEIEYVVSRSLTGTFVAKDGMTVMAGGLISERDSEQYYRTPILGSIPLLGFLFRGTEKVKTRTELIILIKPHVIMTPYEGGKISAKLMKLLSDHPAADGRGNMGVFRRGEDPTAKDHNALDDLKNLIK